MADCDMFLKVEGATCGPIKGESSDDAHEGEIDIHGWAWGMQSQTDMAGSGAGGKASMRELVLRKKVDSASTALMTALRNNEPIRRAVLTVRKAGGKEPVDALAITIEQGRITSLSVDSAGGGVADIVEQLAFSFQRISVEYTPQGEDGATRGAMRFETEGP